MSNVEERRRFLQEARLQHQLEIQSRQIESVFTRHNLDVQIAGGRVEPRTIRFDLRTYVAEGLDRLTALAQELRGVLRVPVHIERENGMWRVRVSRDVEPPVSLLDMLAIWSDVPPQTAVLGLSNAGEPIFLPLDGTVSHVLIAGSAEAGKTTLLRTIAVSLAMLNRQSRLQLAIIGPESDISPDAYGILEPLNYLPHIVNPVVYRTEEAADLLNGLVSELDYRQEQRIKHPAIVVLVDRVAALLENGGEPVREPLTYLVQHGIKAGIYLVMTARRANNESLPSWIDAHVSLRITGRVDTPEEAYAATGLPDSQAEYLLGQGDFLAVSGDMLTYFQGAFVSDSDLHMCITELQRRRARVLLAQPVSIRPHLSFVKEFSEEEEIPFGLVNEEVALGWHDEAVELAPEEFDEFWEAE
ncbi:MAG: hypothetical protein D6706_03415 [Chloroflexi bacterium]|nr:MAG: hypothetical protein D6706_03415 [Chloroflexota bacterium]